LVEASALKKAAQTHTVEDRIPYLLSWDVLIQYMNTLAVSDGFMPDEIYDEVKQTFCFQTITRENWQWLLNFISAGSQSLQAYDEYKKVTIEEDGLYKITSKATAMHHRMSIGTIVGDAVMNVKFLGGGYVGSVEETFISKLSPGDIFQFAGKRLELYRIKNMEVLVKKATAKPT